MATPKLVELDPSIIAADDNIRYSLLDDRINALAKDIETEGRVTNPIEVSRLSKDAKNGSGKEYLVNTGHYRHAATLKLNAAGAGMKLPCIIVELSEDRGAVIKHKIAENVIRQDMTPMDVSRAMRALVDAGVPRIEIQNAFPVKGGRRGSVSTMPASPAYVWMHLRFADLPKSIQNGLHDGSIPVTSGIEFVKIYDKTEGDKETRKAKMDALLADIDAERQKEFDSEENENKRFLDSEAKRLAIEQKDAERKQKEETARSVVTDLEQTAAVKSEEVVKAYQAQRAAKTAEDKKAAKEAHKAKMVDSEAIDKKLQAARKELEKLVGPPDKPRVPTQAASASKPPVPAKVSPAAPVKPSEVKAAGAKASGKPVEATPLNLGDLRKAIDETAVEVSGYANTAAVGALFQQLKNGEITVKKLINGVAKLVGDKD